MSAIDPNNTPDFATHSGCTQRLVMPLKSPTTQTTPPIKENPDTAMIIMILWFILNHLATDETLKWACTLSGCLWSAVFVWRTFRPIWHNDERTHGARKESL